MYAGMQLGGKDGVSTIICLFISDRHGSRLKLLRRLKRKIESITLHLSDLTNPKQLKCCMLNGVDLGEHETTAIIVNEVDPVEHETTATSSTE